MDCSSSYRKLNVFMAITPTNEIDRQTDPLISRLIDKQVGRLQHTEQTDIPNICIPAETDRGPHMHTYPGRQTDRQRQRQTLDRLMYRECHLFILLNCLFCGVGGWRGGLVLQV